MPCITTAKLFCYLQNSCNCLDYVIFIIGFPDPYISDHNGPNTSIKYQMLNECLVRALLPLSAVYNLISSSSFQNLYYLFPFIYLFLNKLLLFYLLQHGIDIMVYFSVSYKNAPGSSFISAHTLEIFELIRKLLTFHSDV